MTEPTYEYWIDPQVNGFFSGPAFGADFQPPKNLTHNPGLLCAYAIDRAKKGDFALIPTTLEFYGKTRRAIVDSMILGAVAYAGPASCFPGIVDVVKRTPELAEALDFCGVMAERGELSYVPIFLNKYLSDPHHRYADYLVDYISDLLGDGLQPLDPEDFQEQVSDRYRRMADDLGTDKALVFRGERYSVARLARHMLNAVQRPYFRSSLRRSFEAATGIDCSSWYQEQSLRPLAATATLEGFLDTGAANKYQEGVRYFFGHRIPG